MTKEVSIDLETMDNTPTSAIIAIGAVITDNDAEPDESGFTDPVIARFYSKVSLASSVAAGMTMSPGTVLWWMQQSNEARGEFKDNHKAPDLKVALGMFSTFLQMNDFNRVWGNGSDFDNAILRYAYERVGLGIPWKFWQNACYRTIKGMYPEVPFVRQGVYHNALADAESQGLHLVQILRRIEDGREKTQLS